MNITYFELMYYNLKNLYTVSKKQFKVKQIEYTAYSVPLRIGKIKINIRYVKIFL
jgi:hypothetical protein